MAEAQSQATGVHRTEDIGKSQRDPAPGGSDSLKDGTHLTLGSTPNILISSLWVHLFLRPEEIFPEWGHPHLPL